MNNPFNSPELQAMIQQLKAKTNYDEWLKRLEEQRNWILTKCPTIESHIDIENIRIAIKSVKPCRNCDKKFCPKETQRYTYVGEISWWNDRTHLRWVPDCRDARLPPPTIETYRRQIETEQQALAAARGKL